jgi:hypothetical protein
MLFMIHNGCAWSHGAPAWMVPTNNTRLAVRAAALRQLTLPGAAALIRAAITPAEPKSPMPAG